MTKLFRFPTRPDVLFLAFLIASASVAISARQGQPPRRFAEAELFLELNHTDGDLGFHASIDGQTWTRLAIEGPGDRPLLNLLGVGRLRAQGLTQLAFESAEPTFEELDPAAFLRRFPEGPYEIEGTTPDGQEIESTAVLSHVLAAPPSNVTVFGVAAAESCDAVLPVVSAPVVIRWDPVTSSHPEVGKPGPVRIRRYQLFVEREGVELSLDLPPTVTRFEVPTAITDLGKEFKFEIIARTTANNNTAIESCFKLQ
jgi:hypothetical protein